VTSVGSKKAAVKSATTYEQQIDEEEVSFAVYCFLWDFNAVRKWLQKSWLLYKQGYTDLASVSTLTNTAFDMFQRAEAEILACVCVVSELESGISTFGLLCLRYITGNLVDASGHSFDYREEPGDMFNYSMYSVVNLICYPVWLLLLGFAEASKKHSNDRSLYIPLAPEGTPDQIIRSREDLSIREQMEQDTVTVKALLAEICIASQFIEAVFEIPGQDELTSGTIEMIEMKNVPIWLVLAYQVHLDVHQILHLKLGNGQKHLFKTGIRATINLQQYLGAAQSANISNWSPIDDAVLGVKGHADEWIKADFLGPRRQSMLVNMGRNPNLSPPFCLLRQHPILCDGIIMHTDLLMQNRSIGVVNALGAVQSVAHSYNAVKNVSQGGQE
jgi:hypothetical protein